MIMMALSQSSSSSSAGGGVGMSRAAKKRAKSKKRKESSQTITETDETTVTVTETHHVNNNDDATSKTRENCSEANTSNIKDDYEKQRQQISIKTKKKKMKLLDRTITTDNSNFEECNDEQVSVKNVQKNNNDNDGEGGLLELHGLENMLLSATLTPRQILLLDDTAGVTTSNDDNDGDDQGRIGEEQKIGNCNLLMSEIATQHRARILLASLLSPSGVSVNDFYDTYWGKQPLLATYRSKSNSTTSNFTHANDDDDCNDDDVDDEEEEKEEEDRITSNNKGQNKEKGKILHTEQSKPMKGGKGGGTVSQLAQQHVKEEHYNKQHTTRLDGFLTRSIINDMMSKNKLRYGLDLNVTRYTDIMGGKKNGQFGRQRITLDPPPKKREKKKKKLSSSSSNGDEDDKFNSNYDDDVEYVIANPTDVWANVDTASYTLRLLRPHEHNDDIHTLLSLLEVEFGCMVGSNAYLTPLHSQGFAPHYDDVDVFICQLEGYKRWRVYSPMSKRETLPRLSSRDYTEKEMIDDMELVLDVMLGPGDVLYMPRGWIHQAETVSRPTSSTSSSSKPQLSDKHSLHLTISAMQNWCWADYLEVLMPVALESATVSDKSTSLREGLPRNFLHYMGTMHQMDDDEDDTTLLPEGLRQAAKAQQDRAMLAKSNQDEEEENDDNEIDDEKELKETRIIAHERQRQQRQFKEEAKKRIMRVCKQAMSMLDDACDEIGKRFLSDRLPPALLRTEACFTKEGCSNGDSSSLHHHHDISKKIWPNTLCRIVRRDIARLVVEDSKAVLYHCLDNSRVYHGTPLSPMEFEIDDAPALEQLLTTVEPHWIMVKDLIHGDMEDKMEIAQTLFNEGILATILVELPDRSVKTG